MGLASRRSADQPRIDNPGGVEIIETIEMRESLGIAHAPGIVAVLDSFPSAEPDAFAGRQVEIRIPDGRSIPARVEAVRDRGATISFFFRGLTPTDVPEGSRVEFDD